MTKADARQLIELENLLHKPIKLSFIVANDRETKQDADNIIILNGNMFIG